MRTQNLLIKAAMLISMAAFGLGCAKKSGFSAGGAPANTAVDGTGTDSGGGTVSSRDTDAERGSEWQAGSITSLTWDWAGFTYYAATHALNSPQDLKISVKLNNTAGGYNGKVMISYFDNGQYYTGRFLTDSAANSKGTTDGHDGQAHADYNRWFTWNGPRGNPRATSGSNQVFHGFYEDQYGAILLIIDGSVSDGDGLSSALKGEVWVRNYEVAQAPRNTNSVPCWFIELGPYDCRTFLTSNETLNTSSALYPDQSVYGAGYYPNYKTGPGERGWRLLGRFSGLDRAKAGL